MLLTITSTAPDAAELGYLLHKHPDRVQHFDLPVGRAQVFYPEATETRCTAALMLEVDPVGLVRGRRFGGDGFTLGQYVNDRPYAASSLLAVAIARVFSSALKGRCEARPELVATALPLTITVPAAPTPEGPEFVRRMFEPLGWGVTAQTAPLDPAFPDWGDAPYVDLELRGTLRLADALSQVYVLLPVLDGAKHYWVGDDEVDKLIRTGGDWLATHPERETIMQRYLARQRSLVDDATARLAAIDDAAEASMASAGGESAWKPDGAAAWKPGGDCDTTGLGDHRAAGRGTSTATTGYDGVPAIAGPGYDGVPAIAGPGRAAVPASSARPLAALRRTAILDTLRRIGAGRVVDLGCGEGALLREMLADPAFIDILGVDVSARELSRAERRLGFERLSDSQRARIELIQSSVTYTDKRLQGWEAMVLSEVIEHLDADRLPALEHAVFGHARPNAVIVTTPNADYNTLYPGLPDGAMRHPDHRFEFTRADFDAWARRVGREFGYAVEMSAVGNAVPERGGATQLAVFTADPRTSESRTAVPSTSESRTTQPRTAEPGTAEARRSNANATHATLGSADHRSGGSR